MGIRSADRPPGLVAAASTGPVPQLLWMMTSIVADNNGRRQRRRNVTTIRCDGIHGVVRHEG
jgi:hypothetical protein